MKHGYQVNLLGSRRDAVSFTLADDHPSVRTLIDHFNSEEPAKAVVNGILQGVRVTKHQWEYVEARMTHRFELLADPHVPDSAPLLTLGNV